MKHTSLYLKRTLSAVMAFIMVFGVFSSAGIIGLVASAADEARTDRAVYEGAYWRFYDDGEVVFFAELPAMDDEEENKTPWKDLNTGIDYVDRISSITIAPSVKKIGKWAFRDLKVRNVFIPDSVESIDKDAFVRSSIKTIYFPGHDTLWDSIYLGDGAPSGIQVKYDHRHLNDVIRHSSESTCVRNGYEGDYYCSECGAFVKTGEKLDKSSHKWSKEMTYIVDSEGNTLKETCKDQGKMARYCTVCGTWDYANAKTIQPDTSKHEFTILEPKDMIESCSDYFSTDAKCQKNYVNLKCKHCGKKIKDLEGKGKDYAYYLDYVNAKGEKLGNYVLFGDDNNGVNSGWKKISADKQKTVVNKKMVEEYGKYREQMTYKNSALALDHHRLIDSDKSVAPTCTGEGKTVVICEWCKKYHEEFKVPALGHSDKRGDKEVIVETIPATCPDYDKGTTGDGVRKTMCADCGVVLGEEKLANLHTENYRSGSWVTVQEPDCVNKGVKKLRCNYCKKFIRDEEGKDLTKDIPATPSVHTESRWVTTLEPTCTEKGERVKVCLIENCPYHSTTPTGEVLAKASDRKALDTIENVVKDTDRANYDYDDATGTDAVAEKDQVNDVAEAINITMHAAFQEGKMPAATATDSEAQGKIDEIAKKIAAKIEMAVKHHTKKVVNSETLEEEILHDNDEIYKEATGADKTCTDDDSAKRYVFSEIVKAAAEVIVKSRSVINEADDIIKALEDAWTELGDEDLKSSLETNPGDKAELIVKATSKEEIPALEHNFVRVAYVYFQGSYVPVGKDGDAWKKITGFKRDEEGNLLKDDDGNLIPETEGEAFNADYVNEKVDCTSVNAVKVYLCTNDGCSETKLENVEHRERHAWQEETIPATCDSPAQTRKYCLYCDEESVVTDGQKLEHEFEFVEKRPATCSKAGIKVKICKHCGLVDESTYQTIETLPHKDVPVNEAPTCLEPGRRGNVCSVCDRFEGEILDPLGHDYVETIVEPTCTEQGYTTAVCSRCGEKKEPYNYVHSAGHQYGETQNAPASCEKGSYTFEQCKICGYKKIYNEIDNALGHSMKTDPAKAATCTADGYTERKYCTRCGYVEKESTVIDALGHARENIPYKAATCTADGNEAYVRCSRCGIELKKKVVIPKTNHLWKDIPAVEATCETAGSTAGRICEYCNEYDIVPQLKPATGHNWSKAKITKEATAFRKGVKEYTCDNCGGKREEEYELTFFEKILWVLTFVFSLPIKLMARLNGEA